ncbi:cAMP-regulated phosphoprotein 21-like [Hyposmocoma kahamanoa]|uniref:cAMP-regulated phosphoprotein 21-like n=1 Tax=Hyposmocoma kahamanoa TaxID=1477025 RepID=UPI000E6D96D5|nr:cAMP-regulated phosphoprotein 21-like [Hyposmocoma kahamanoa]
MESQDQRQRTKRWLGHQQHSRDLLSNNPRVACVCGACNACPHCRGRRRKRLCQAKQDSGIVCSEECPDCGDSEPTGGSNSKAGSVDDKDDQIFYCRCPERKEKPKNISLSRMDSDDKSELSGPDLVSFIKETLNKSTRDRTTLLRVEKELNALVNDTRRCVVRFPVMSSYGRMLVHRCAALFQLSHHLDQANKGCVTVTKSGTSGGRIPCTGFRQWCTVTFPSPSPQRHNSDSTNAKSILKRDTSSLDEPGQGALSATRSKSLEQREKEYERVRRRIFSSDNCVQDEFQWPWLSSGPVKLLTPGDAGRNKLLKVQSLEGSGCGSQSRGRGAVSKSHSFGGYGGEDQNRQVPRLLSRQGDLASSSWRLSPSSSGYRTLSLHSTDSVTPSPTGGASPEPMASTTGEGVAVVWAVTDLSAVPPGAIVLHPQTGRPLTNPDGSVYHFEPDNPPPLYNINYDNERMDQSNEKRRGRLEKQHSFIDNECECQPSEESRKCCCECRRHDNCTRSNNSEIVQVSSQSDEKPSQQPKSPCKNRYQQPDSTTHSQAQEVATNHRPTYTTSTNEKPLETTNQRPVYENQRFSPNPRQGCESRTFEPANQQLRLDNRTFEMNQKFEPTNQRNDLTSHRPKEAEVQCIAQHGYHQGFTQEEVTTSAQVQIQAQQLQTVQYVQPDLTLQPKTTPVPVPDPNIRPISLTNVVYPAPVPQHYQFINQCRVDQQLQPLYQPVQLEEQKLPSSPSDSTFRIDPSYPYSVAVDYSYGACVEPASNPHPHHIVNQQPHQHRSFNMSYGQVEMPQAVLPQYPVSNVALLPQPMQPYPYQEPVQWQNVQQLLPLSNPAPKLLLHELLPTLPYSLPVYPPTPYNVLYPQMIPQPYPVVQPVYPVLDNKQPVNNQRPPKRNSISGSSRNTPMQTPPDDKKVPYDDTRHDAGQSATQQQLRQHSSEVVTARIQEIQHQVARLNMRGEKREWRRRNSGNGILGSYPANTFNGRLP